MLRFILVMGGVSFFFFGEEEEEEVEGLLIVVEVKLVICVWVEDIEFGSVSVEFFGISLMWEFVEFVFVLVSLLIN